MLRYVQRILQRLSLRPVYDRLRPFVSSRFATQHWMGIVMNTETRKLIDGLKPEHLDALEISGRAWNQPNFFRSYLSADYPEFDVCSQTLDETFDLVIAEQVFEHLLWPYRAGKNVYAMLRPGGWFMISTPFLLRVHNFPTDCSRWTEVGLKHFLAECGFPLESIQTGSWEATGHAPRPFEQ